MKKSIINSIVSAVTVCSLFLSTIPAGAATPVYSKGTTSTAGTVNVNFTQKDTIELSISDNTVSFGAVNMLVDTDASNVLTTVIRSSKAYDLTAIANDDFKSITDLTATPVPVSKLQVKVDSGNYTGFTKGNSKLLVSDAASYETGKTHTISFKLADTIGYKAGDYTTPLTITATQK